MTSPRTKPFGRDRRAGDPCDRAGCNDNAHLVRVNPKGAPGIFECPKHATEEAIPDWYDPAFWNGRP